MTLPPLYFRIRDNGAAVFRVDAEARDGRLNLEPLAFANVKTGEIRVQGDRKISGDERSEIEGWITARQASLAERETRAVDEAVETLNGMAHWIQSRASDEDIEKAADALLLAMHDLRSQIVRRKADALSKADDNA